MSLEKITLWQCFVLTSCLFFTVEIEGQVKRIALWDTVILAVYLGCILHILANAK